MIAHILNFQADRMFYAGDFKAARSLFEQASQTAARTADRELIRRSSSILHASRSEKAIRRKRSRPANPLLDDADRSSLKSLVAECSVTLADALVAGRNYPSARQELERSLRNSDKLGLQALLAKSEYLMGEVLRLSGNQGEAARHYGTARHILDEIRKEAGSEKILGRSDFATIYQESGRWSAPQI